MGTLIVNPFTVFSAPSFIFTVDTTKPGSASNTFILPTYLGGYDFSIDWGDNVIESYSGTPGNITHVYSNPGVKTITIKGIFPAIRFFNTGDRLKLISVDKWGDYGKTGTFQNNAFSGCSNLTSLPSDDLLVFAHATEFANFCYETSSLTSLPNYDLSSGTTFASAWQGSGITDFPALNIPSNADCTRAWRFSSLTTFSEISLFGNQVGWFQNCTSLTTMPPNLFDNNTGLTHTLSFVNCAFNQQSVDNILVSFNTSATANNLNNGSLTINGGTSATPSATGQVAADALRAKGWTVLLNGY